MQTDSRAGACSVAFVFLIMVCGSAAAHAPTSLKQAFKGNFVIGAAMNEAEIAGQDQRADALLAAQFNSISPENVL